MLDTMLTGTQVKEWLAYAQLEPFGPLTDRAYAGSIVAAHYNVHRKPDTDPLTWLDIFPLHDEDELPKRSEPTVDLETWADLSLEERAKRWAAMSEEERQAFYDMEARAVASYMSVYMGATIDEDVAAHLKPKTRH